MASKRPSHIYVVRHGKAEDEHPGGDGHRALTAAGREQFKAHADQLSDRGRVTAIASSPLVRAVQTAELLAASWRTCQVVVRSELAYELATAAATAALLNELGPGWAIVGHNPSLAEALQKLLRLPALPRLRKGAVVALVRAGTAWQVDWVAAPGRKVERKLE